MCTATVFDPLIHVLARRGERARLAAQYQRSAYRCFIWYGHALTRRKIQMSIRLPVSRPSAFASIPARLSYIAPHSTRRAHLHQRGRPTARRPLRNSAVCTISPYESNQHHASNTQVTVYLPSSAGASLRSGEARQESTDECSDASLLLSPNNPAGAISRQLPGSQRDRFARSPV